MQPDAASRPEIRYSEEEALLAQSAADLLEKEHDFAALRRAMTTASGYDAALYRRVAELGWIGLAVPAAYGGAGLHAGALASLFEAMGRRLVASPVLASTLACQALLRAGSEAQKQAHLPRIVRGEAVATVALGEPHGSFERAHMEAEASARGGELVLHGQKAFVLDAQNAELVIVALKYEGRPALVLIERPLFEERLRPEVLIDETRRSARLRLDGLVLPKSALLDGGDAQEALAHVERVGFLLLAAEMAGGAEGVLQLTLEYLKTRKQFGKLIGGYQALKHPMVEILCAIEAGRSLLYHAATVFEEADPQREVALRMAKAQLGETFTHAADRSIQFHGGIGFTYECHAQLFFRRAQFCEYTFGDSRHHRQKLAMLSWP